MNIHFTTIIKECESELLSEIIISRPIVSRTPKNEIREYLVKQNKYRSMYFNLAFGKCKYKKLFIQKFYQPIPKYNYNLKIDEIDNWEQKYYLLLRAFKSTGAFI